MYLLAPIIVQSRGQIAVPGNQHRWRGPAASCCLKRRSAAAFRQPVGGCGTRARPSEMKSIVNPHPISQAGVRDSHVHEGLDMWLPECNSSSMRAKEMVVRIGFIGANRVIAAFARIRKGHRNQPGPSEAIERLEEGPAKNSGAALDPNMLLHLDLSLAAEHLQSIRWLLEIARQHQQPIPTAALTNLELVSKHLGAIQRRIQDAAAGDSAASTISALVHRRGIPSPLHRPPPSCECRVSPSGRSRPCG